MKLFQEDPETKAVVIYGEQGGTYEEDLASYIKESGFNKPIAAFIAGIFAESLPSGQALGHAGAIIEAGKGRRIEKVNTLKDAGVKIAVTLDELPNLIKNSLE